MTSRTTGDASASGTTRERLTRARVVAAALAVVDRDGLEGLTMRALGRELGVDPMAAYHHVPNKAAILQGVIEAILAEIPLPVPGSEMAWPDVVRLVARSYRCALLAHPNALPVASTQPPLTRASLGLIEAVMALLVHGGLSALEALEVINATAALVIGSTIVDVGVTPGTEPIEQQDVVAVYAGLPPEDFPILTGMLSEVDQGQFSSDRQFEDLVDAYVRGVQARVAERA